MAETITIGTFTFVVAPEEAPKKQPRPKPKRAKPRRPPAPQCTASRMPPMTRCSDGYYRMRSMATEFEREKNKKWWQRL
jgi:hypothetical protein